MVAPATKVPSSAKILPMSHKTDCPTISGGTGLVGTESPLTLSFAFGTCRMHYFVLKSLSKPEEINIFYAFMLSWVAVLIAQPQQRLAPHECSFAFNYGRGSDSYRTVCLCCADTQLVPLCDLDNLMLLWVATPTLAGFLKDKGWALHHHRFGSKCGGRGGRRCQGLPRAHSCGSCHLPVSELLS